MILWEMLFRSQQRVVTSFLDDVWTRNPLSVFVAPLRTIEYVAATCLVGVLRVTVTLVLLAVVGSLAYGFHFTDPGLGLLPFLANLMPFGCFLGMVSTALIMRWGQAAESQAWAVPLVIQPLAAVFYPVSVLPQWLQPIAKTLPSTPIFEGMRVVLAGQPTPWGGIRHKLLINLVWGALAAWIFAANLRRVSKTVLLVKVATQ